MKVNRKRFQEALESVRAGLAKTEIIENSTNFNFEDGFVFAYNDELCIRREVDLCSDRSLAGSVPAKELLALLRKIKDDEIDITENEWMLRVTAERTVAEIVMRDDAIVLSELGLDISGCRFSQLPDTFLSGVERCLSSISNQPGANTLRTCIHMQDDVMESCDNFRVTKVVFPHRVFRSSILLPGKSAAQLIHHSSINKYALTEGWIHFRSEDGNLTFSCRTLDGEYFDTTPFVDVDGVSVELPEELVDSLDIAGVFSDDVIDIGQEAEITIEKGTIIVRGEGASGWVTKKSDCSYCGESTLNFVASVPMLKNILKVHNKAVISGNRMRFDGDDFIHVICLEKRREGDAED